MALGLQSPWQVQAITFAPNESGREELNIMIGFPPGSRFADQSGTACPVHDTVERRWQHLSFFGHACYLHCAVPRIKTPDGKVATVAVPWARPGSGFTLLFEALALALIEREMPVNRVAEIMRVNPQRIWTVFTHWVGKARAADDPSAITKRGVDETSTRKGHHYVTLGVDAGPKAAVIHVTEGIRPRKPWTASRNTWKTRAWTRGRSKRPASTCRPPSSPGSRNPSRLRR